MTDIEVNANMQWKTNDGEPLPEGLYFVSVESDGETTEVNYIPFDAMVVSMAKAIAQAMESDDG